MLYFKLPFTESLYTFEGPSSSEYLNFASFEGEETVKFKGQLKVCTEKQLLESEVFASELEQPPSLEVQSREDYEDKLRASLGVIKEKKLEKLVLSRRKVVPFKKLSLTRSFLNLTRRYPEAFCYVFTHESGAWIGAFSELLGSYDLRTGEFKTMSVAGTLTLDKDWGEKELEEQAAVTRFIEKTLSLYAREIEKSSTYSHPSGEIKHLRTDFTCQLPKDSLQPLIKALHPTPAVLGMPKDVCLKALKELEPHPRELYAGYSHLRLGDCLYFYVNLRCARLFKSEAHLFVGGGITAKSDIETEFQETELKALAVLNQLALEL